MCEINIWGDYNLLVLEAVEDLNKLIAKKYKDKVTANVQEPTDGFYRLNGKFFDSRRCVAGFDLFKLPSADLVFSAHAVVINDLYGIGIGSRLHKLRLDIVKNAGRDGLVCSVRRDNLPQIAILRKFGWVFSDLGPETFIAIKYFNGKKSCTCNLTTLMVGGCKCGGK